MIMKLTYTAYAVAVWISLAFVFLFELPGMSNVTGGAIAYLLIFPLVAVGFSAELLIHVPDDDKRNLTRSIASGALTNGFMVTSGSLAGVMAIVAAFVTWKLGSLTSSAIAFWITAGLTIAWLIVCPAIALGTIVVKAKQVTPDQ